MRIKLTDILTIYISPDHNEKYHNRKVHIDELLKKLGFKNVVHFKSSNEKYPFCLNNATIEIFSKYKPPFLLLEDDIESTDHFTDEIDIPDTTDAFYLGLSSGGGHQYNNYDEGSSKFKNYNDKLLKIENMLTTHAILYLNSNYINHIRNLLITKPTYYNDVIISQIQKKYNIYCFKNSYFYQSLKFDGHENATKIEVSANIVTLTYVTAFLNINNNETNNYFSYFEKLAKTNIPIVLFMDKNYKEYGQYLINTYPNVKILKYITKDDLQINKYIQNKQLPINRNPNKDTVDYIALMNNKIYFMEDAMNANIYKTDVFAWIDFRIYHIFSDDINNEINTKLNKLSYRSYPNIEYLNYFPGNLENKEYIIDSVNWRFLGGFFIVNKKSISKLVKETSKLISNLPRLTWEVNIWAIIEYNNLFNFEWFFADHNISIILE